MQDVNSASKVIDALGGTAKVADLTNTQRQAVSNWRKNNRIAARTFLIMQHELRKRGFVASPKLWGITPVNE